MNFKNCFALLLVLSFMNNSYSQNKLPFSEIPEAPKEISSSTITARMIQGVGFRYYWATEGLRNTDLSYRINSESRSSHETIDHIYNLSIVILNSLEGLPNTDNENEKLGFKETRKQILFNLKRSSKILSKSDDLSSFKIIFQRTNNKSEYPFWNQINGPIEDAVWHSGQLAILRRASGNPINPKASVFSGKIKK